MPIEKSQYIFFLLSVFWRHFQIFGVLFYKFHLIRSVYGYRSETLYFRTAFTSRLIWSDESNSGLRLFFVIFCYFRVVYLYISQPSGETRVVQDVQSEPLGHTWQFCWFNLSPRQQRLLLRKSPSSAESGGAGALTNILTNTAIVLDGPRQHRAGFFPPSAAFLLVFEIIFVSFFLNVFNFWHYWFCQPCLLLIRTCIHNRGMPDGRGFFSSDKEISLAILTYGKGKRRRMAGKRPLRRRSTVVNTGS